MISAIGVLCTLEGGMVPSIPLLAWQSFVASARGSHPECAVFHGCFPFLLSFVGASGEITSILSYPLDLFSTFPFCNVFCIGAGHLHLAMLWAVGVWLTLKGILINSYFSQAGVF